MSSNYFIAPIIMKKKKHDFRAWIKLRKVLRHCHKTSPSFDEMCAIGEFIRLLREVYMYSNSEKFHLYQASFPRGCHQGNCCSMIYKDTQNNFSITFVLLYETREIHIELNRGNKSGSNDKEQIEFIDGQYRFKDDYDMERMQFIISCLMNGVEELVLYYYKNKKF